LNLNWQSGLLPENVTGLQRWRLWNAGKQSLALLKDKLLKSMQALRRINRCLDTQSFLELLHYITAYPHCLQRESQPANPTQIESLVGSPPHWWHAIEKGNLCWMEVSPTWGSICRRLHGHQLGKQASFS